MVLSRVSNRYTRIPSGTRLYRVRSSSSRVDRGADRIDFMSAASGSSSSSSSSSSSERSSSFGVAALLFLPSARASTCPLESRQHAKQPPKRTSRVTVSSSADPPRTSLRARTAAETSASRFFCCSSSSRATFLASWAASWSTPSSSFSVAWSSMAREPTPSSGGHMYAGSTKAASRTVPDTCRMVPGFMPVLLERGLIMVFVSVGSERSTPLLVAVLTSSSYDDDTRPFIVDKEPFIFVSKYYHATKRPTVNRSS
mmetsp:Transcript_10297/g.22871  ORF Transcript_10297/g.22871 Transcript_10297/m.22871 type:complete len:256 (-) Transcript_10297:167-934(-)